MQYFKLNVEETIGINAQCINVRKKYTFDIWWRKKNPQNTTLQGKTLLNLKMYIHFCSLPLLCTDLLLQIALINGLL